MVRGPRTRPVPKAKVVPEDGETIKAAMKNGGLKNHNQNNDLIKFSSTCHLSVA